MDIKGKGGLGERQMRHDIGRGSGLRMAPEKPHISCIGRLFALSTSEFESVKENEKCQQENVNGVVATTMYARINVERLKKYSGVLSPRIRLYEKHACERGYEN